MKRLLFPFLIIFLMAAIFSCEENNGFPDNYTLTDFDGNEYETVQIGEQLWMSENFKSTHYANGTLIPLVEDGGEWAALECDEEAMCFYDNLSTNKEVYGALYTWAAAVGGSDDNVETSGTVQGVCPDGWHIPSDHEWNVLEMHLGMDLSEASMFGFRGTNEGSRLAGDAALWMDGDLENDAEFASSGFSALPGGYRPPYGAGFTQMGDLAEFWSSTASGDTLVFTRLLQFHNTRVNRFTAHRKGGQSVRCVKDDNCGCAD